MLSKCANPNCGTSFRYLHEGRIFVLDVTGRGRVSEVQALDGRRGQQVEVFWLCASCAPRLTVRTTDGKIVTRTLSSARELSYKAQAG